MNNATIDEPIAATSTLSLDPGLTVQLGEHSYIHDQTIRNPSGALTDVTIGKFCSIATDLTIIGYDHHHEWITPYPFLDDAHRANWPGTDGIPYPQEARFGSNKSRGNVVIGNDVWIGYNVKLFKGVTIGNGAVIGACSLVNKSVEPYTIVAGTPARLIRKRFTDSEIAALQRIRWWDWPAELVNHYMPFLCSSKILELEESLQQDPLFLQLKAASDNGASESHQQNTSHHASWANSAAKTASPTVPVKAQEAKAGSTLNNRTAPSSEPEVLTDKQIQHLAKSVGDDWKDRPYYDDAEQYMDTQWRESIWPFIKDANFSNVVDLAAGHGRNSEKLKQHARKIHIVDINQENIDFCRKRFEDDPKFTFNRNDGCTMSFLPSNSVSLLYCFDAMVHFDSDVVRAYLKEFKRVLQPGGLGFCHHSNFSQNPGGDVHDNPGWRNFMSQALFAHYCRKEGLIVVKSRVIDWERPGSDCLTLFRKDGPAATNSSPNGSHVESAPKPPAPADEKKPARIIVPAIFNRVDTQGSRLPAPAIIPAPIGAPLNKSNHENGAPASSRPRNDSDKIRSIIDRVRPYTMVPDEGMAKTIELTLEAVSKAGENDVIVECGTWKGGSSLAMILAQKEILGEVKHPVWMFDSFAGLPEVTEEDGKLAAQWQQKKDLPMYFNNATAELQDVLAMMKREQIDESHYRIFKGWFNQTLGPASEALNRQHSEVALLRLDGDWYESTRDCLNWMFPKLRKGAPCIVDDYYAWDGCALALHEYLGQHRIAARLRAMPVMQGVYFLNKVREDVNEL